MAIIDVVKNEMKDGALCCKFPSDDLRIGTQLIVYPSQTALFVKGGKVCDEFHSGTYTLKSENIPILNKLINLPFGKESPFKAEVWFVNQVSKLNIPWGTPQPIQLEDPKYHIIVPVRAHGQYGIRVNDPRLFLETLIGNMTNFTSEKVDLFFKGRIIASLNTLIAEVIIKEQVSVLDISTRLISLSDICNEQLNSQFEKYGISIVEFAIVSISVPENDSSVVRLKQAKDTAARLSITGRDIYQMERSFDVLEKAAENQGAMGQMMALGTGIGAGVGIGNAYSSIAGQVMNTNPMAPPPIPPTTTYFIYINGKQIGGQSVSDIALLVQQGVANADTLVWTAGMANWKRMAEVPELSPIVFPQTPPPLP